MLPHLSLSFLKKYCNDMRNDYSTTELKYTYDYIIQSYKDKELYFRFDPNNDSFKNKFLDKTYSLEDVYQSLINEGVMDEESDEDKRNFYEVIKISLEKIDRVTPPLGGARKHNKSRKNSKNRKKQTSSRKRRRSTRKRI